MVVFLIDGVTTAAASNLCPKATQPRSSSDKILWKVILYHPLTVHWTVKPPHWKPNKGIGQGEKRGDGARRRILILCRPLVLTQTPELSAVQRGRCEGQTFSVNWHFVSSGPSLCEGEWKREWASERAGEWSAEREKGERKLLFLGLLGLVEGVYGSLLILC